MINKWLLFVAVSMAHANVASEKQITKGDRK